MMIGDSFCVPRIQLTSVVNGENKFYSSKSGWMKIDKTLWSQGILKAEFSFAFDHAENPKQEMFWKGKIYARIQP